MKINWIASYPKSGNTWVRLFLMAYAGPASFHINQERRDQALDTSQSFYEEAAGVSVEDLTREEIQLIRGAALVRLSRKAFGNTGESVYLKTHSANAELDGLAWIPPTYTAHSLYLLRDPRDVLVSMTDHLGQTIDLTLEHMADKLKMLGQPDEIHVPLLSWSDHVKSWLRDLPYDQMAVRYEDLLNDPDRWFQAILNFFDIAFDRGRFNEALVRTTFDRLRSDEDEQGFESRSSYQERFFRRGQAGGWRDVLTEDQAARVEADHGDMMRACGYMENGVR